MCFRETLWYETQIDPYYNIDFNQIRKTNWSRLLLKNRSLESWKGSENWYFVQGFFDQNKWGVFLMLCMLGMLNNISVIVTLSVSIAINLYFADVWMEYAQDWFKVTGPTTATRGHSTVPGFRSGDGNKRISYWTITGPWLRWQIPAWLSWSRGRNIQG